MQTGEGVAVMLKPAVELAAALGVPAHKGNPDASVIEKQASGSEKRINYDFPMIFYIRP